MSWDGHRSPLIFHPFDVDRLLGCPLYLMIQNYIRLEAACHICNQRCNLRHPPARMVQLVKFSQSFSMVSGSPREPPPRIQTEEKLCMPLLCWISFNIMVRYNCCLRGKKFSAQTNGQVGNSIKTKRKRKHVSPLKE